VNFFSKLIALLAPKERRQLVFICGALLLTALFEMAEVASLGPFIAVVSDLGIIRRQKTLLWVFQTLGFENERMFIVFLGIVVFVLVICSTVLKITMQYINQRYTEECNYSLSVRLFRQYLYQPYSFFLDHNSSELSKNLFSDIYAVINGALRPFMDLLVSGVLTLAVFTLLIIMNPVVALFAFALFSVIYSLLYIFVRRRLAYFGKEVSGVNALRYKIAGESFGGIKDVKILGKEFFFSRLFNASAKRLAVAQTARATLSILPGNIMLPLVIGFAIGMTIVMLFISDSFMHILPMLAVYAFAVMRIVPNVQSLFRSVSSMRYSGYMVDTLYRDMNSLPPSSDFSKEEGVDTKPDVFPFIRSIELKKVNFSYPASRELTLKQINLTIKKDTMAGFVGATGCGKTTLVDVIMGLLKPKGGSILVDDVQISSPHDDNALTLKSWQHNFGYVPQQIFLADDTIEANIAFGIPDEIKDFGSIERAARIANLHDFIMEELPGGYQTVIGERGIRLSGGQRQRIGIARALYHDPAILVMDEATSALDTITEDAVMDAIHNLLHSKTIILIAHRISTVRECDVIYLMDHGHIVDQGSYDDLMESSAKFRAMAKTAQKMTDRKC
jgi:ABC-type multidrug transport system fused ATPase/permease subunit